MTAKIIDGKKIAEEIKKDVLKKVNELVSKNKTIPNIVTIKIGSDPASDLYLKLRNKACSEVGIKSDVLEFKEDIIEKEIITAIKKLNNDKKIHGILIQFPIPSHISQDRLINTIDPKKDVEGLTPYNMGKTLIGDEKIIPCTPLSVLTILEYEKTDLKGKNIVIINHSKIVGKPLAALLLNRNATVSICHVFTKDIKPFTTNADIIISAAGVQKLIKKEHIKKGCFLIDVSIIKTKDGIYGDVDLDSVSDIAGKITPVPGGVGPVTVASSLKNMLITYTNCIEEKL